MDLERCHLPCDFLIGFWWTRCRTAAALDLDRIVEIAIVRAMAPGIESLWFVPGDGEVQRTLALRCVLVKVDNATGRVNNCGAALARYPRDLIHSPWHFQGTLDCRYAAVGVPHVTDQQRGTFEVPLDLPFDDVKVATAHRSLFSGTKLQLDCVLGLPADKPDIECCHDENAGQQYSGSSHLDLPVC